MAEQTEVEWRPTCEQAGCIGIRLPSGRMCLAHASEKETAAALERIRETGEIDACGVPITPVLLEWILAAARGGENEELPVKAARFDRATFSGDARFYGVTFESDAVFNGATFEGHAEFGHATFNGDAKFEETTFNGGAGFNVATFECDAEFGKANFSGDRTEFNGATFEGNAEFGKATLSGLIEFEGATFGGGAMFKGATFSGYTVFDASTYSDIEFGAEFEEAAFERRAQFNKATFAGRANFSKVAFSDGAWLGGATFSGDAWFDRATFSGGDTQFNKATFAQRAEFGEATFNGLVGFAEATFNGGAVFSGATFNGAAADFAGATFKCRAKFAGVRFEQARQFGPLLAWRGLVLDGVQFTQQVQIEVSSTEVCCRRARFPGGVQFQLRWARVVLDDTDLAAPSILAGIPRLSNEELARREEQIARAWRLLMAGEISEWPQLVSMRRANVAGLGLSNVSAADCRFAGAHNLDKLRLESDVSFATAPSLVDPGRPRRGGRKVIAEERAWRADPQRADRSRRRWVRVAPGWPDWLGKKPDALNPGQIAGLYRALRKGREDVKDEPGAADFYYGEMEMRRKRPVSRSTPDDQFSTTAEGRAEHGILMAYRLVSGYCLRAWRAVAGQIAGLYRARRKGHEDVNPDGQSSATVQGRVERGILTAYWLVSGYGLRASRALATLLLILALATVGFVTVGFAPSPTTAYQQVTLPNGGTGYEQRDIRGAPPGWAEAATYSVQSTTSLLRAPTTEPLTESGRVIEIMVRLLGPLLIGLALLALRGRVKR